MQNFRVLLAVLYKCMMSTIIYRDLCKKKSVDEKQKKHLPKVPQLLIFTFISVCLTFDLVSSFLYTFST